MKVLFALFVLWLFVVVGMEAFGLWGAFVALPVWWLLAALSES